MYENVSVEFSSIDRDNLMTTRTLLRVAMDILDYDTGTTMVGLLERIIKGSEEQVSKVIAKIDDAVDGERGD